MQTFRCLALATIVALTATVVAAQSPDVSVLTKFHGAVYANPIAGQFIVVFNDTVSRDEVSATAAELAATYGGVVHSTWHGALIGFAVALPEYAAKALAADTRVAYVEQNATIRAAATQGSAPWHLGRIWQRTGISTDYHYCSTGSLSSVYVIDTGVWAGHSELSGRVKVGVDLTSPTDGSTQTNPCAGTDNYDAGHGTAVASIIAGTTFGVAKSAGIVPVRVLDCTARGSIWTVVDGVDWVYNDFNQPTGVGGGQIANLSFEVAVNTTGVTSLETSVQQLNNTGVTVVAAAGNQNSDVAGYGVARMADVITVAGSDENDARWLCNRTVDSNCTGCEPGSNYGAAVKLFAPSHNVRAAHILTSTSERAQMFPPPVAFCNARAGTSFAAPIVSGVLARRMSEVGYLSPTNAKAWLYSDAGSTNDIILNAGTGSPTRLVYKDAGGTCP